MILLTPTTPGSDYYRISQCGRYTLAKTFHNGVPVYGGWFGKQMLECSTDKDIAIAAMDAHAAAQNASS